MPHDTPFVAQPNASPTQSGESRLLRGDDYADAGTGDHDESVRAVAYAAHLVAMNKASLARLAALKGNSAAARSLLAKTMPLLPSAPPYIESA